MTSLPFPSRAAGLALAVALQLVILGAFTWQRAAILMSATDIVLPVRPVDPRDLFRGDYVTLAYDISRATITPDQRAALDGAAPFWVTITRDAGGTWSARVAGATRPAPVPGAFALKARAETPAAVRRSGSDTLAVRYGLESYFVPEGTGRQLEQAARDKILAVVAAIGSDGTAAIKGLMIDGRLTYREPAL